MKIGRAFLIISVLAAAGLAILATEELPYRQGTIARIERDKGRITAVVDLKPLPGDVAHEDSYRGRSGTGYYEYKDANGDTVYSLQDTHLVVKAGQSVHLAFWIGTAYFRPVIGTVIRADGRKACTVLVDPKKLRRSVTDPDSGKRTSIGRFFHEGAKVIVTDKDG
jgi:hypothetical protein